MASTADDVPGFLLTAPRVRRGAEGASKILSALLHTTETYPMCKIMNLVAGRNPKTLSLTSEEHAAQFGLTPKNLDDAVQGTI